MKGNCANESPVTTNPPSLKRALIVISVGQCCCVCILIHLIALCITKVVSRPVPKTFLLLMSFVVWYEPMIAFDCMRE
jgi:hypothetical protein